MERVRERGACTSIGTGTRERTMPPEKVALCWHQARSKGKTLRSAPYPDIAERSAEACIHWDSWSKLGQDPRSLSFSRLACAIMFPVCLMLHDQFSFQVLVAELGEQNVRPYSGSSPIGVARNPAQLARNKQGRKPHRRPFRLCVRVFGQTPAQQFESSQHGSDQHMRNKTPAHILTICAPLWMLWDPGRGLKIVGRGTP
jgi:hypothetical protein